MGKKTHEHSGTKIYRAWCAIKKRCHNPSDSDFPDYGARGIAVCGTWRNDFAAFLAEVGYPPTPAHSLDRIDNDRGYEPGNVRWATAREQQLNKRNNRLLTFDGRTQPTAAWASEIGISRELLFKRLKLGWPVQRALSPDVRRWE